MSKIMSQATCLTSLSPLIPGGKDLEKTVVFYEQQLGFKRIHQEGDPIYMAVVARDSVQIFLVQNEHMRLAAGANLRINVNGIEDLYAEFQTRGGEMIDSEGKLATKPWGMKEFIVQDLEGSSITFCEPANS